MRPRTPWIALALTPLAVTIASFFFEFRFSEGRFAWVGYALYAFAAFVCALNFYLSWVRYAFYRFRTGSARGYRHVSGIPVVGDVIVVGLALVPASPLVSALTLVLIFLNSGSLFWLAVATLRDPTIA